MTKSLAILIGMIGSALMIPLGAVLGTKVNYATITKVVFFWGTALACSEIWKQIFLTAKNGYYDINRIPFQLCSTCMYVALLIPLLKVGIVRDSALAYIGIISFTAAFFYFVNPSAIVQTPYVSIKIHSFLWHWSMLFIGAMVVTSCNLVGNWKAFLGSFIVFAILVLVAVVCNVLYTKLSGNGTSIADPFKGINFYYLREGASSTMPLFNKIFPFNKPYVLAVPCFIVYFAIGSSGVYGIMIGVKALIKLFMRG